MSFNAYKLSITGPWTSFKTMYTENRIGNFYVNTRHTHAAHTHTVTFSRLAQFERRSGPYPRIYMSSYWLRFRRVALVYEF